jgi:RecQ family ATP-dependent DNA helicase
MAEKRQLPENEPAKRTKIDSEELHVKAVEALCNTFGHKTFREPQEQVVLSILNGRDTLVILPTGKGKSLCYQLPALILPGTALVVSPLISLMQDQTIALKAKGVSCAMISSAQTAKELDAIHIQLVAGDYKLVYVSPERVAMPAFQRIIIEMFAKRQLSFCAIDEAHCISQWGEDFRPSYYMLNFFKNKLPRLPLMALTASAPSRVREDIVAQLKLDNHACFSATVNRPEIFYEVRRKEGGQVDRGVILLIKNRPRDFCIIVYCFSRNSCEEYAKELNLHGVTAKPYHAKLSDKTRTEVQHSWMSGETAVICATIAFGMGIDKANVRLVVHATLPQSMEAFYQESGRAGRDGLPARSVIFYSKSDVQFLKKFIAKIYPEGAQRKLDALDKVADYCALDSCRRKYLLAYFGETADVCNKSCDVCKAEKIQPLFRSAMEMEKLDVRKLLLDHRESVAEKISKLDADVAKKLLIWLVKHNHPPGLDSHLTGRGYLEEQFLKHLN